MASNLGAEEAATCICNWGADTGSLAGVAAFREEATSDLAYPAATAVATAVATEALAGVQILHVEMMQLKTHIDGCNAKVAETTADQKKKFGRPVTNLIALYDGTLETIQSPNKKVEIIEAG